MAPWMVGLALMMLSVVGVGAKVLFGATSSAESASPISATLAESQAANAFYADVRRSLTPLLRDAERLTTLIAELKAGDTPAPAVSDLGESWAESFTSAGDAVAGLTPPGGHGTEARALYRLGAALYAESAKAIPRLVAAAHGPHDEQAALLAVRRLQALGDSAFDSANRVLGLDRGPLPTEAAVRVVNMPAEVPDFARLGLEPGSVAGPQPAPTSTPERRLVGLEDWRRARQTELGEAAALLTGSLERLASRTDPAGANDVVGQLDDLGRRLASPLPEGAAGEGVQDLRLGLVVTAEAFRTLASDPAQAQRLGAIAGELWSTGTALVPGEVGA